MSSNARGRRGIGILACEAVARGRPLIRCGISWSIGGERGVERPVLGPVDALGSIKCMLLDLLCRVAAETTCCFCHEAADEQCELGGARNGGVESERGRVCLIFS